MTLFQKLTTGFLTLLFISSLAIAAGLESTAGVATGGGTMLDTGSAQGAVKRTNPADGAIVTPPTDSAASAADAMQPTGITNKTSRSRAKQVCAANDTKCQQEPPPPKSY